MKLGDLNTNELAERIEGFTYLMQQAFQDEFEANPEFAESGTTWTLAYFVSSFAVVATRRRFALLSVARRHDGPRLDRPYRRAGVHRGRRVGRDRRQVRPHAHALLWLRIRTTPGPTSIICGCKRATNC